jgi:endo-1,4-beta-xylanase
MDLFMLIYSTRKVLEQFHISIYLQAVVSLWMTLLLSEISPLMKNRQLWIIFLLWLCVSGCGTATEQPRAASSSPSPVPTLSPPPARQSLGDLAHTRGLLIGSTVHMGALRTDAMYRQVLGREFSMVTPEVAMKFDALQPQQGVYTFTKGDTLVAFAQEHNMQIHGHTLVWHNALPSWITKQSFTRTQLMDILKNHIQTVMKHYRGKVSVWDVVNEAIEGNNGKLRNSLWRRVIGPDYIDMAFRWAHEVDPQAHLYYNDFGGEGLNGKSDAIYNLVKGMLRRGVPLYGVGLQMHLGVGSTLSSHDVQENMRRLTALGLKVQITEMDVSVKGDSRPLAEKLEVQAYIYAEMLRVCLAVKGCEGLIMWGFTDRYTWLDDDGKPDAPLIFDADYQLKPAYRAMEQELITQT